ncbi:MAG: peptidase MA family metallohydrolase [Deltaproteobacteria bacterium]|nr:peptidase MA family metallohydrolase [Deltaproteobacteria bacterium]
MLAFIAAVLLAAAPCRPALDVRGPTVPDHVTAEFAAVAGDAVDDVRARLGSESCAPITITLVPAMEDAPALDPPWHLPSWAAGAAVPRDRRIVVGVTSGRQVQQRETTLIHEIAHVVSNDAAGGRPLPRWLDEGIARVVAGEHGGSDLSVLARAHVSGQHFPLASLERGFPPRANDAALAYAEAGRAVSLIEGARPGAIAAVLARIKAGDDVDAALVAVTGRAIWQLDRDVQDSVSGFAAFAVLGAETDMAMAGCALVVAFAGVRARRRIRERMHALDDDDPARRPAPDVPLSRWTVTSSSW